MGHEHSVIHIKISTKLVRISRKENEIEKDLRESGDNDKKLIHLAHNRIHRSKYVNR
jgi:hypothetical protein